MNRDPLLFVALLGALSCAACGDGVGEPIVGIASGGAGGAGPSAAASMGGNTGMVSSSGGMFGTGVFFGAGGEPPAAANDYCSPVADWPESSTAAEDTLLTVLNSVRYLGVSCTDAQRGPLVPELRVEPALVCAARRHSLDMVERDFFSHTNPDGEDSEERVARAGYMFGRVGEVIARGPLEEFVLEGGEDCSLLVDPAFEAVGVGVHADLWTVVLASPGP